jgi:hypothetical protein
LSPLTACAVVAAHRIEFVAVRVQPARKPERAEREAEVARYVVVIQVDLGVVVDAAVDAVVAVVVLVGAQAHIEIRQRPPCALDANAERAGFDADARH